MSEWKAVKIDQLCEAIIDCVNKTAPVVDKITPYRMIRTTNVKDGHIDLSSTNYVTEDIFYKWTRRSTLQKGDIILTREAPLGEVGKIIDGENLFLGQRLMMYRPDPNIVDPDFLFYAFRSKEVQYQIKSFGMGSTVEHMRVGDCSEIIIKAPGLQEQREIGKTLALLDRKISNLCQQNETLEKIAQTLFKHWFMDFEFPNEDGKPYRSSGGEMVRSELGEIPVGWRVGTLGDIGENIRDGINADEIQPEMSYIALEHMPRKQIALDSWGIAADIASNKFIFKKGNILFGKLRPYFHKVGVAFFSGVCSTDILVLNSKHKEIFSFLLMILSSIEFISYISLAAEGTRMPRTSWQYMKEYPVCIPDDFVVSTFNDLVKTSLSKIENNIFQIQALTKTRNVILPKLMSGQIRVKV